MGESKDYSDVPDWEDKDTGYQAGSMVKAHGCVFVAAFWARANPAAVEDHNKEGWRLYDELYDLTTPRADPPAKLNVIAYIPAWRKKEKFNYRNAANYRNITHGIIAFLTFSETNLGMLDQVSLNQVKGVVCDVVAGACEADPEIKIMIAVGGANDYGFQALMTRIGASLSGAGGASTLADPEAEQLMNTAAKQVAAFVEEYKLHGVDLDLECWWSKTGDPAADQGGRTKAQGAHPAGYGLTAFAAKLAKLMPGKLLSAAVPATSWYGNNFDCHLAGHVDWLGVMTYDLTGSWSQSPVGPHSALFKIRDQKAYMAEQQGDWPAGRAGATTGRPPMEDNPIFSVEEALWYWSNCFFANWQGAGQRVPRSKLALGVPLYGYDFAYAKDPDAQTRVRPPGYKVLRYRDILGQFPEARDADDAHFAVPGSTPRPSFVTAPGTYPFAHNIYFETPRTAAQKIEFARTAGAAGVIAWEMSSDIREMSSDIREVSGDVREEGDSILGVLYRHSGHSAKRPGKCKREPQIAPIVIGNIYASLTADSSTTELKTGKVETVGGGEIGITGPPAVAVVEDGDTTTIYCVHQGKGDDGYLWWTMLQAKANSGPPQFVPDKKIVTSGNPPGEARTSAPPAVAVFGGILYCVHHGFGSEDDTLYCCKLNLKSHVWSKDMNLHHTPTARFNSKKRRIRSVALVEHEGLLYCFRHAVVVSVAYDSRGVSTVTYDDQLSVFRLEKAANWDGEDTWSKDFVVEGALPGSGPGLASIWIPTNTNGVYRRVLECLYEHKLEGRMYHVQLDANGWTRAEPYGPDGGIGTTGGPSTATLNGGRTLYVVHEGRGDSGEARAFFNNLGVSDEPLKNEQDQVIQTGGCPTLFYFGQRPYLLHEGYGADGNLMLSAIKRGKGVGLCGQPLRRPNLPWVTASITGEEANTGDDRPPEEFITWNMQGSSHSEENKWRLGIEQMLAQGVDFIALQEAGTVPGSAREIGLQQQQGLPDINILAWNLGTNSRPDVYYIFHVNSDTGGNRCNLAIVTRTYPTSAMVLNVDGEKRPVLGVEIQGVWYFTVHANSRGHPNPSRIVQAIDDATRFCAARGYEAYGDWNLNPSDLDNNAADHVDRPRGHTHPSTGAINTYDYRILNGIGAITGMVLSLVLLSDHFPVKYSRTDHGSGPSGSGSQ